MDFNPSAAAGQKGGVDGCIDFDDPDNNGLQDCTSTSSAHATLNAAYEKVCDWVSLADFVVIAAEAVITETSDAVNMGGTLKSQFSYGRTTSLTCAWAVGRLPNPEKGCT